MLFSQLLAALTVASSSTLAVATANPPASSDDTHPFLSGLSFDIHQDPHERFLQWMEANPAPLFEHLSTMDKRAYDVDTSDLPPFPVYPWITQNDSTWPVLANAAVRRMQSWFNTGTNKYDELSWWQQPVMLMSYMDLDRALGENTHQEIVTKILNGNRRGSVNWMIDAYVDDQAWWGLAAATASELYGVSTWLDGAKAIQANDASYWTSDCGGGLLWLTYKPDYGKNTVTNTLQIALSAKLYKITGSKTYLDDATRTLKWWQDWAYDNSTGRIWDTLTAYDCEKTNLRLFTYNSAIILGGLVDLYTSTGGGQYLALAQNIAFAAMRDFSTNQGMMKEDCETDGPPRGGGGVSAEDGAPLNNLPYGCQSDTIMFKSILAQNLGYLYRAAPDVRIYNYLTFNFLWTSVYNVDETFLFSEFWSGPFNSTLASQLTQGNILGLLSSGVAVKVATEGSVPALPELKVPLPYKKRSRSTVAL